MNGATLFSGIDAPETSTPGINWIWRAEIDPFANAVSQYHRPNTPNLGDVSAPDFVERALKIGRPDILVFGSPCQSFSVAGRRLGLDDARGNLALIALSVARQLRVRWLVFENVPGLFSSFSGSEQAQRDVQEGSVGGERDGEEDHDFAAFLSKLRECGYLGCYRVFDAQFAGVPQRRRRIFFVGYLGDWRYPAAVLFEPESLSGNPPPSRGEGEDAAPTISARPNGGGGLGTDFDCDGGLVHSPAVSPAIKARDYKGPSSDGDGDGAPLIAQAFKPSHYTRGKDGAPSNIVPPLSADADKGDQDPLVMVAFDCKASGRNGFGVGENAPTLRAMGHKDSHQNAGGQVAVAMNLRGRDGGAMPETDDMASLRAASGGSSRSYVSNEMAVRRLTPRECERLQGYPDDHTLIPWKGKPAEQCPDGPRYMVLGNSMALPVIGWVLDRVQAVDAILKSEGLT